MGASVLNFDQRNIVKTRRNCFTFPLILCDNNTTLISVVPSRLLPCALHLHPWHTTGQWTRVWQQFLWTELKCSGNGQICFEYQVLSLVVLLYPILADEHITLSLNIRIFQTHFSVFYFTFLSLNGFYVMSRKEQIAATYLRLCLVHVDFLV